MDCTNTGETQGGTSEELDGDVLGPWTSRKDIIFIFKKKSTGQLRDAGWRQPCEEGKAGTPQREGGVGGAIFFSTCDG